MPRRQRFAALVALLVIAGAGLAALPDLPVTSRVDQLAQGLPELQDAKKAEQVLGASGEVSVELRGQNVSSPAVVDWERRAQDAVIRQHGDQVKKIITLNDMLGFLGNRPTGGEVNAAVGLLPNYLLSSVISPDHKIALMVFGIKLQDLNHQRDLLGGIQSALPPPPPGTQVRLVGLPVTAVSAFDAVSGGRSLLNLAGIAAAGLILLIGLGNRRDTARAMVTVLLATGWVLGLTWLLAGSLNPLTLAIGCLTTATGCEFAVMLSDARRRAAPAIGRSAMIAALAGVLGYLTLSLSGLAMLREFGLLLAASVGLSFAAAALTVWLLPPESTGTEANLIERSPTPRKELTGGRV
jgi:predicted RND superfamily exporter protein